MPRKGRRSQAQKERWRKAGAPELPDRPDMPVDTPPCSSSVPNKKLGSTLPAGPFWTAGEARVDFRPQCGTGKRHRVLKWPTSPFSGLCHKLVIPPEVPGKKFVLIVGDSHLRALVDDVIQMPESQLSFGFMSTPGASASQIHKDVLHAAVPRRPDAVCVMAPSNNLTSSTVDVAGLDFANLLTTCLNRWSKVFVVGFVPRLVVDVQHQDLLRQEYRRVATRMNVKYFSSVEHFPLSNLILWSNDGVHLSDREGMGILVQLLWSAASDQLLTPPATPEVSPKPPVKNAPGQESSPAPPSAQPRKRRTIGQDGKTSQPRKSRRIASQQEKESVLPLNPIWFSGQALSAMEEVSPSHESCLAHVKATQPVPPHKKAQTASSAVTRRRSRQVSPLNKDLVSTATALCADGTPVSKIEKASVANMPSTVGHDVTSTKDLVSTATALYADGTPVSKVQKASVANMPSTVGHDVTSTKDKTRSSSHLVESIQASHSQNDTRPHTGGMPGSGSQCVPNPGCIANGSAAKDMKP